MAKLEKKPRRVVVRNSSIHGRGVFALRRIPKGTRIIEYKGKLITDKEADRRYSRVHEHSPHTMLFSPRRRLGDRRDPARQLGALDKSSLRAQLRYRGRRPPCFHPIPPRYPPEAMSSLMTTICRSARSHTKAAKREHACFCGARRCRGTCSAKKSEISGPFFRDTNRP